MFPVADFPAVAATVEDGIKRSLHTGVQIYVSRNCSPVLDSAYGEAAPDCLMTSSTVMPWRSAGKPLTALLILKSIEDGKLKLSTRLDEVLSEASGTDTSSVTIFDMLTHQSGFPATETGWPHLDWDSTIKNILRQPRQLSSGDAAYHPQSSWFLLGEILRRLEPMQPAEPFDAILQRDLLHPLGLVNTSCGISADEMMTASGKLPVLYERDKGQLQESSYCQIPWLTALSPGGNLRGPIRELGRFLEVLLQNGRQADGTPLVTASTVQQMTTRHRVAQYDQTLQHVVDFGLGVICNSNHHGPDSVPYGFGRYADASAFGHGGSQCSIGFCDPENKLVVAWSANGFCGEGQHQRRNRLLNEAIYQDLGLA